MTAIDSMLAEQAIQPLNASGWTVMLVSVSTVVLLVAYCYSRVLRLPRRVKTESRESKIES